MGFFVPGLPTVPFLLLTAWFAARGSKRLHRWLYEHPHFGKLLIDWEKQRAISRTSKMISVLMLIASWVVMYYRLDNTVLLIGITIFLVAIGTFLVTRPEPNKHEPNT